MKAKIAASVLTALLAASAAPAAETRDNGEVRQTVYQVNVNDATADQLKLLYRIGDVTAGRIIEERAASGPFVDLADLEARVRGIGPKTIACNADFISFSGPTDLETKITCAD